MGRLFFWLWFFTKSGFILFIRNIVRQKTPAPKNMFFIFNDNKRTVFNIYKIPSLQPLHPSLNGGAARRGGEAGWRGGVAGGGVRFYELCNPVFHVSATFERWCSDCICQRANHQKSWSFLFILLATPQNIFTRRRCFCRCLSYRTLLRC